MTNKKTCKCRIRNTVPQFPHRYFVSFSPFSSNPYISFSLLVHTHFSAHSVVKFSSSSTALPPLFVLFPVLLFVLLFTEHHFHSLRRRVSDINSPQPSSRRALSHSRNLASALHLLRSDWRNRVRLGGGGGGHHVR